MYSETEERGMRFRIEWTGSQGAAIRTYEVLDEMT